MSNRATDDPTGSRTGDGSEGDGLVMGRSHHGLAFRSPSRFADSASSIAAMAIVAAEPTRAYLPFCKARSWGIALEALDPNAGSTSAAISDTVLALFNPMAALHADAGSTSTAISRMRS